MKPFSRGGLYLNFAGFGKEKEAMLRDAYGQNYERLAAIKTQYDPTNLFRMNLYQAWGLTWMRDCQISSAASRSVGGTAVERATASMIRRVTRTARLAFSVARYGPRQHWTRSSPTATLR